jgi:ribose 5-phosphate isomerase RpiB
LIVLDENVYPLSVQLKRVAGVNPKICWDRETAVGSRDHNVLLLSSRLLGIPSLKKITEAWLHS